MQKQGRDNRTQDLRRQYKQYYKSLGFVFNVPVLATNHILKTDSCPRQANPVAYISRPPYGATKPNMHFGTRPFTGHSARDLRHETGALDTRLDLGFREGLGPEPLRGLAMDSRMKQQPILTD